MEVWKLIILGFIIGSNNLAIAFALGSMDTRSFWLRIVFVFGCFEFLVPFIGVLIGKQLSVLVANYASYIGGSILLLFGFFLLYKSFNSSKEEKLFLVKRVGSWTGIISLAAGLSIDNLIVGFSIGLQNFRPLTISSVIAGSSILFTIIGLNTGKYLKHHFRKATDIFAACLLLLLGLATLFEWI